MDLVCPKCQGTMRTYERNGVHVDQCSDCRGIFLDRGELERLVDAENAWHGADTAAGPGVGRQAAPHPETGPYRETAPYQQAASRQQPFSQSQDPAHSQPPASTASLGAVVSEVLGQVRGAQGSSHGSSGGRTRKKDSFLGDLFG